MFTGIIQELGEIKKIQRVGKNTILQVSTNKIYQDANIGDSIAVNGTCLTLVKRQNNILDFEMMPQTIKSTNLGTLRIRDKVNLEPSLKVGDKVGGHFIYGHIDCLGIICKRTYMQNNLCFEIVIPPKFILRIIPRGSIAVDGISLTVQDRKSNAFLVYIIPHTAGNTTLGFRHSSDKVNIELDKLGVSLPVW